MLEVYWWKIWYASCHFLSLQRQDIHTQIHNGRRRSSFRHMYTHTKT